MPPQHGREGRRVQLRIPKLQLAQALARYQQRTRYNDACAMHARSRYHGICNTHAACQAKTKLADSAEFRRYRPVLTTAVYCAPVAVKRRRRRGVVRSGLHQLQFVLSLESSVHESPGMILTLSNAHAMRVLAAYFDARGAHNVPKYKGKEELVDIRYIEYRDISSGA